MTAAAARIAPPAALAALSLAAGATLAAGASRFGAAAPLIVLVLPLAPLLALAVFAYPPLAVLTVFATFPIGSLVVPGLPPWLQPVETAVLAMATLVVLRRLATGRTPLRWSGRLWWAVGLVAATLVALPSAVDHSLALKQIASLLGGLVFACVVLTVCRSVNDVRLVVGGLVVVAAGLAVQALVGLDALRASAGGGVVEGRLRGVFAHPNELGSLCAISSLLAVGLAFGSLTRRGRALSALALVPLLAGLTFSLSRGAWIGLALGTLVLLVALREARRTAFVLAVPLVVAAAAFGAFAPDNPQVQVIGERVRTLAAPTSNPYDSRPAIWREALREIRDDPLTGQGPGGFPVASARSGSEASTVYAEHAHNIWLTWGAEVGLPSVLLIVGFIGALAFAGRASGSTRREGHRRDRAVTAGIGAALVSMLGHGLVNYSLRNSVLSLTLWGLVGALLVARERRAGPRTGPSGRRGAA
ncbi:MAG: O-antigen ligase family protein [Gaiellaceae bacterium]